MKTLYQKYRNGLEKLRDIPLLLLRLLLAYGFYGPAMRKIQNFEGTAQWFESMNYPFPLFSAYLAGVTELLGVFLLLLGLGTRIISLPLMFVMGVAIFNVHWAGGFAAANNGFEIPLYYLLMLLTLTVFGSGRISVDYLITRFSKK
jgi:putative oxidoreductase